MIFCCENSTSWLFYSVDDGVLVIIGNWGLIGSLGRGESDGIYTAMLHMGLSPITADNLYGFDFIMFESGIVKLERAEYFGFVGIISDDRS